MVNAEQHAMSLHYMAVEQDSEEKLGGLRSHYEMLQPKLRRLLTARLGSPADAEDLMQDLWIKLAQIPSGPVANPSAYLHKMALNLANDLVRSRMRQRGREAAWSDVMIAEPNSVAVDPSPSPETALAANMQLDLLMRAIRTLPERAQQVFRRHRIDGASHAEVAAEFGISKSAVEKNMATAMKHLMRAMSADEET
jgi:RNA polymerase sigma factor (sigma-70 family)